MNLRPMLAAFAAVLVATAGGTADYEVPRDRSAKDILAPAVLKGAQYRIRDVVATDGYTDRWTVDSDFGIFDVDGDGALRKLLVEIPAIAELSKASKTEAFAKGLGGAAKAPIGFVKSLVTNPVDTISGVPKGAYELVENASVSVSTTRNPAEDSRAEQLLKMSSHKRDLAYKLNVDVYSSNKVLQKHLNSVAWASTVGDWAFSAAMLPAGVGGTVVSNVRLADSMKNVLKDEPPQRLRIINDDILTKLGITEDVRKRLLDHPNFTPRHTTIICKNLERLAGVTGLDAFLTVAGEAQDEPQANLYTAMAQLLRGYHQTVSPLTAIVGLKRIVVAQTKSGRGFLPLPVDRLIWTDRVDRVSGHLKSTTTGAGAFDLWLTGTVSPRARQELGSRGVTVTENVYGRIEVLD